MNNLQVIVHDNRRVLTTKQIAETYGATEKKIVENFNNNKRNYEEGKHYILLTGEKMKKFKSENENFGFAPNLNKIYLWTDKGALLHAKSLNTDEAWEIYDNLIDGYYKLAEEKQSMSALDQMLITMRAVEEVAKISMDTKKRSSSSKK